MARINRNAPCPCGSGKKYKRCCGKHVIAKQASSKTLTLLLFLFIALFAGAALISVIRTQPLGDTEVIRVWVPEHGHFHTITRDKKTGRTLSTTSN